MLIKKFYVSLSLSLLVIGYLAAQNKSISPDKPSAEKIYLQLDRKVYSTNNTIWFKCIVTNAFDHSPTAVSGVLYVDLIDANTTIVEEKLIKLDDGIGQGSFKLSGGLAEGLYSIRAYTDWNRNFGDDFVFTEQIRVIKKKPGVDNSPIKGVNLIYKDKKQYLEAEFYPGLIDSLHKREIKVFITLDGQKDSLYLKRDKNKQYKINYPLAPDLDLATLQIQTSNHIEFEKSIVLNKHYIDLQFFPESGELVHGFTQKVGFKALDAHGLGKQIKGAIIDEDDSLICTFSSNQLGMGTFKIASADSAANYSARIVDESGNYDFLIFPLPKVIASGNILKAESNDDDIMLTARSTYLFNEKVFFQISCRGRKLYDLEAKLQKGYLKLRLPKTKLPEGIVKVTMLDARHQPLAERLFFNHGNAKGLMLDLTAGKEVYSQREKTHIKVDPYSSEGKQVEANLSLMVINREELGDLKNLDQNILSYFLLDSELRGKIESPGYYFRKDTVLLDDIDALLLTQGWRRYFYAKPPSRFLYKPENALTVSGDVRGMWNEKKRKKSDLTLVTFGEERQVYTQATNDSGRFTFLLKNEYGGNMDILIQSNNKKGKKVGFNIAINQRDPLPVNCSKTQQVFLVDSIVQEAVTQDFLLPEEEDFPPIPPGNVLIDEVVKEGHHLTPIRKKVIERLGEPDIIIPGKEIQAKEEEWSFGLFSVLMFHYPDKVFIERDTSGNLVAHVKNYCSDIRYGEIPDPMRQCELTVIVVDGKPVTKYEYQLVQNIPPSEVSSFEIIEYAKDFAMLHREVSMNPPIMERFGKANLPPETGHVIAIYTRAGKGLNGVKKPIGISYANIPVFSAPDEFYTPKYENQKDLDWSKEDLRSLVYWQPVLKKDKKGSVSASYYNADKTGKMLVIVEGISAEGEIGYQELEYTVVDNEENTWVSK